MCLLSDNFNIFKIHVMMTSVDMTRKFGVVVEHQEPSTVFFLNQNSSIKPTVLWTGQWISESVSQ